MVEDKAETKAPASTVADDGMDRKTLFVRSVPFEATSEELSEFFSQFAPVKHAVIVNDANQKSRGFGFVSFTMDDDTITALAEARKTKFQNRLLRVDIAKRRDRKDKEQKTPEPVEPPVEKRRSRLIIRNLPWSCKKPDVLKKIFSKYGAVFDAYIPKKKGGQMSGFAFVTMRKKVAAERAVKESVGLKIDGREVAVDLALEKSKWEETKGDEEEEDDEEEEEEAEVNENDKEKSDSDAEEENEDEAEDADENDDFHDLNDIKSDAEPDSDEEIEVEEEEEKPKPKNRQEQFSIFVRNIPYDADEESLKEHFSQFGEVKYALPVIDKETGLAKGSAFVAFKKEEAFADCVDNAPSSASTSLLIADDVSPAYVYQGRILSISPSVDRQSASRLAEKNSEKRKEVLGKAPGEKDKRNLFLLNEGRITTNSKLAQVISKTDLELREKSYKLRVQQLNKNPTLHLSLTRLAIRNLPRAMNEKALRALGRKAVVQFATEVKEGKRQPLSKEETTRSDKLKHDMNEFESKPKDDDKSKKSSKNKGVIKQAKVIMEVKGTGETGRSRGYGFVEFRDHRAALMGLRWLNAHEVTIPEILEGLTDEEKKVASLEGLAKRNLIVEFAIENAQVVKRRRDKVFLSRNGSKDSKGNMNKGPKDKSEKKPEKKSDVSDEVKKIIGAKRRQRKGKK
ncbi:uncharacterized protein CANTADRAFT_46524 [Suhomyces tanzawaensis NRRL Y-17324]|uniref:RRM domain-containing protein n=1 Tax=Suhomyces tanzawaensis NRRL Y-17324 TaxID=984487 RepID=A0A1E4SMX5_9ASCO|nr:uncharacterized protein CANTADRAFT_46524 [Suhomyces tanzawaensis NRRL Y-17324]ODV80884.1 hypothetical protein CANTADRAFT_46524 [Suhomyces tanzawaensis NRRL Y-17324]